MANAFSHLEHNAAGHFRLNLYAAVYHIVHALRQITGKDKPALEKILSEHRFLGRYLEQILPHLPDNLGWEAVLAWWRQEIASWEADSTVSLPLVALSRECQVTFAGRLAIMIVALAEEDSRFGNLFEALQRPMASRRPSLTLVGQLLRNQEEGAEANGWAICRGLLSMGLIEVVNAEAPRSEWTLRLAAPAWSMIRGESRHEFPAGWRLLSPDSFPQIKDLIVDSSLLDRLQRVPLLLEEGKIRALVIKGMPGSDQLHLIGAVARALGRGLVVREGSAQKPGDSAAADRTSKSMLGPLCIMGRYIPVFTYDIAPGETAEVPPMPGYAGPIGIILGLEGGVGSEIAESALTLNVTLPNAEERRRCWEQALGDHRRELLDPLSERFILPQGHIRRAAAMAVSQAAVSGRTVVELGDARAACRTLNRQMLDTHAALVEGGGTWHDLVVSNATTLRLVDLQRRCRQRERLLAHLGDAFTSAANRGVRALLTGSSGTGKTLAARILAAELGMDLYRVDLGAVVNKYIGETEKNLHHILSRSETLDVILLLDEGDSLLANRTEVKSANDRYANLETNYLLQRLETYQGIVLITTNAAQQIDRAFQRRMDVVVPFLNPQADERREIWRLHLPNVHAIDDEFFEEVVQRCAMSGGQIRNAALHATLLAVDDGRSALRRLHLEAAVRGEYRKIGATCPLDAQSLTARPNGMSAFLDAMRS
jgi:hypothetical protein